jgi:hypothetical protein
MVDKITNVQKFKWASDSQTLHVVAGGIKVMGSLNGNEIKLQGEIPSTVKRAILLNMNAKPKTSKVYGYALI